MIKFSYTYLFLTTLKLDEVVGFELSFGNEEEWDDVCVTLITKSRKYIDSVSYPVSKEWIEKVCKFLNEQEQLKTLSSWIYKNEPHNTEHLISIEGEGWNRDISIYNLGQLKNHIDPNYYKEEVILLEFLDKIKGFLKEVGIDFQINKINKR